MRRAPRAAGAAACIIQKHPDWTLTQLRGALFQNTTYFRRNGTYDPLFVQGYGLFDAYSASQMTPKVSDLNEDFHVNVTDLLILLAAWGSCPLTGGCPEDFGGDGQVNVPDLLTMLAEWG